MERMTDHNMIAETAMNYAERCHQSTNHRYDNHPYVVHLRMVVVVAVKFIHLIPERDRPGVLAGCWCHDVIEDCRQTYNDVKKATNEAVAELAYALTNEKGRNRKERANAKYYEGIRAIPYAVFIKVCDRIANYKYSLDNGGPMAAMYKVEMDEFIIQLYTEEYDEMFKYLRSLGATGEKNKVIYTASIPQCPYCEKPTKRTGGGGASTLAYFHPVYDEKGNNTNPDRNTHTSTWHCYDCKNNYTISGNRAEGYFYKNDK